MKRRLRFVFLAVLYVPFLFACSERMTMDKLPLSDRYIVTWCSGSDYLSLEPCIKFRSGDTWVGRSDYDTVSLKKVDIKIDNSLPGVAFSVYLHPNWWLAWDRYYSAVIWVRTEKEKKEWERCLKEKAKKVVEEEITWRKKEYRKIDPCE